MVGGFNGGGMWVRCDGGGCVHPGGVGVWCVVGLCDVVVMWIWVLLESGVCGW